MIIRIIKEPGKHWDKTYPRLMRDTQNDDIVLVSGLENSVWVGTKIYNDVEEALKAAPGKWAYKRLRHYSAIIILSP